MHGMALAGSVPDRDWAYLPVPVLCTILDMLPPEHIDHLRFGAVCKQWTSVSEDHNQAKQQRCGKQLPPMLLIPTENHTPTERRRSRRSKVKILAPKMDPPTFSKRAYLVESSSGGDHFYVQRNLDLTLQHTNHFKVYKLLLDEQSGEQNSQAASQISSISHLTILKLVYSLAHEVGEKHVAIAGDLVVQPSDNHFWFHRPRIVLLLIHFILFQNSFELAFFFWIWVKYGFDSCIMGEIGYIIPRLVIGALIQFVCSYSTLPLTYLSVGLEWPKRTKGLRKAANGSTTTTTTTPASSTNASSQMNPKETTHMAIQKSEVSAMEEGNAGEIAAATLNDGQLRAT
uniref:F-box domain-containing protein n=1 Tax=Quercus lobata TaxID=97700 RepID=A0A7N2MSV9_QUELO